MLKFNKRLTFNLQNILDYLASYHQKQNKTPCKFEKQQELKKPQVRILPQIADRCGFPGKQGPIII